MPKALLIELHSWRGVSVGRDLFLNVVVLGFVTIAIARFRVTDWLKSVASELRILKGRTNA